MSLSQRDWLVLGAAITASVWFMQKSKSWAVAPPSPAVDPEEAKKAVFEAPPVIVARPMDRRLDQVEAVARTSFDMPIRSRDDANAGVTTTYTDPNAMPAWRQSPRRVIPPDVLDEMRRMQQHGYIHTLGLPEIQSASNRPTFTHPKTVEDLDSYGGSLGAFLV